MSHRALLLFPEAIPPSPKNFRAAARKIAGLIIYKP
jgi:hypothetical protein